MHRHFRPGTIHFVVTLEQDCIALGGHYYSKSTFTNTLKAHITEHFFGTSITNNEHSECGIILFKLGVKYLEMLKSKDRRHISRCLSRSKDNPINTL